MTIDRNLSSDRNLTQRFRRNYWFWNSLLANLTGFYEDQAYSSAVRADVFLEYYLKDSRRTVSRIQKDWERGEWADYIAEAFRKEDRNLIRSFCKSACISCSGYGRLRKIFLDRLWEYMNRSDCIALYLVELLSNEPESAAIRAVRECVQTLLAQMKESLHSQESEEEEPEWEDLPWEKVFPFWMDYALYMLTAAACVRAMELEHIREDIPAHSELLTMLKNTMEEYRSITQVEERTFDIYELQFSEETGRTLTRNEYLVFLTAFLLTGNDHLYGSYYDAIKPFREKWLPILALKDRDPKEYVQHMKEELLTNQAALDFSHPRSAAFYLRSIGKSMSSLVGFQELYDFSVEEPALVRELEEELRQNRLQTEKERFLQGDFSGEHLYNSNDQAFGNIHSGIEFEEYLRYLFTRLGYESSLTKATGDQGADLILKKNKIVFVVQAKFYDKPVGNKAVQEAVAAIKYYEGNRAVVVTNNVFTASARSLAEKNQVILIDREKLEKLIQLAFSDRASSVSLSGED